jgi:hypothetical protein
MFLGFDRGTSEVKVLLLEVGAHRWSSDPDPDQAEKLAPRNRRLPRAVPRPARALRLTPERGP